MNLSHARTNEVDFLIRTMFICNELLSSLHMNVSFPFFLCCYCSCCAFFHSSLVYLEPPALSVQPTFNPPFSRSTRELVGFSMNCKHVFENKDVPRTISRRLKLIFWLLHRKFALNPAGIYLLKVGTLEQSVKYVQS